jgi:hypothetical protein
VEQWINSDGLGMMQQLGVIPGRQQAEPVAQASQDSKQDPR